MNYDVFKIIASFDKQFDSDERKIILWELLERYKNEFLGAGDSIKCREVADYVKDKAIKCSDLQNIICFDLLYK